MATIDKRAYEDCGECGRRKLVEGTGEYLWYVCDCCGREMNPNQPHGEPHLEASVHHNGRAGAGDLHYCSLPFLKYDEEKPEAQSAAVFIALLMAGLKVTEAGQ